MNGESTSRQVPPRPRKMNAVARSGPLEMFADSDTIPMDRPEPTRVTDVRSHRMPLAL